MIRFRLLPIILVAAFVAIFIKASDLVIESIASGESSPRISSTQAIAAEPEGDEEGEDGEDIYAPEEPIYSPNAPKGPESVIPDATSAVEKELLEGLAKRREELQQWSESISMRENVLNATEMKINQKIADLKALEKRVSNLLAQYNEKEDAKIRSLVKIYESMKPKDAAAIFNDLEMDTLLAVIDAMSERRAAPILAKLDPEKARTITASLAKERRLSATDAPQGGR